MAWVRVFLLLLWPLQAMADVSVEALRPLVTARDVPGVEAMLREAMAADLAATDEPRRQRDLFLVFRGTRPVVDDFLAKWQAARPDSPLFLTAQGWHLFAAAWNARGEGARWDVSDAALQVFDDNLTRARNLAWRAVAAEPELIAASDLALVTSAKLDGGAGLLRELDRVMRLHPNRGSLLNATDGLAPQWGWWPFVSQALCATYAPMIHSVPGYDRATCSIDVVYSGFYPLGPQMQKAHDDLRTNTNPVLDYARLQEATYFQIPDADRIRVLQGVKVRRPLTYPEATILDQALARQGGTEESYDERKLALRSEVSRWRDAADRDPLNPKTVLGFINLRATSVWLLKATPDPQDDKRRLLTLVSQMPHSAEAWKTFGQMITAPLWTGKSLRPATGGSAKDLIAAAEPYFVNEIIANNYAFPSLYDAMQAKVWMLTGHVSLTYNATPGGFADQQNKRLQEVVYCPLIRQVRIADSLCEAWAGTQRQCNNGEVVLPEVRDELRAATDSGACPWEATAPMDELWYTPVALPPDGGIAAP